MPFSGKQKTHPDLSALSKKNCLYRSSSYTISFKKNKKSTRYPKTGIYLTEFNYKYNLILAHEQFLIRFYKSWTAGKYQLEQI